MFTYAAYDMLHCKKCTRQKYRRHRYYRL